MMLYVRHFPLKVELANSYVACDSATGTAWLIDVGEVSHRLIDWVRAVGVRVCGVFITHGHHDHCAALQEYRALFGPIPVYAAASGRWLSGQTQPLVDGATLQLGSLRALVFETPGHTPDHLMLYVPQGRALFSGDALFAGSVGGTSSIEAKSLQLSRIREKVFSLPSDVRIYPGHGPVTTVAIERSWNPFFG